MKASSMRDLKARCLDGGDLTPEKAWLPIFRPWKRMF